jgi:hypothetical protein
LLLTSSALILFFLLTTMDAHIRNIPGSRS